MTDSPELIVLDVGHGNCAILRDTNGTVLIDCAPGPTILKTLDGLGTSEVACVILSHADYDHIGGLLTLLTNEGVQVRSVYLNPDPVRNTEIWTDLRHAVKDARTRAETRVCLGLTTELSKKIMIGEVEIEVLAPHPELAMSGVGGRDLDGRRLAANSMSVVLGLVHDSHRVAMFSGDIDRVGLENLLESDDDLRADILVFPHHGGSPGDAIGYEFSQQICERVRPRMVVFSVGRGRFDNPRVEIVDGVKSILPDVHILCTQLSQRCATVVPDSVPEHLTPLPAKGKAKNSCCGGTIVVQLNGANSTYDPARDPHVMFVDSEHVATPLCLRSLEGS